MVSIRKTINRDLVKRIFQIYYVDIVKFTNIIRENTPLHFEIKYKESLVALKQLIVATEHKLNE